MKRLRQLWTVFGVVGVAACDPGTGISAAGQLVQVASAVASPTTINCGSAFASPVFNVHLVNTTSSDVTLQSVSASGVILRGDLPGVIDRQVYLLPSLPFSPAVPLIRAHDGDVTVRVTLTGPCADARVFNALGGFQVGSYVDVAVTLYMTTNSGQYTTDPIILREDNQALTCVPEPMHPGAFSCVTGIGNPAGEHELIWS